MDTVASPEQTLAAATHAKQVQETLRELRQTVDHHEEILSKLRATASTDRPARPDAPLEIMKTAYDELASQAPFLPAPDSVLPALIALRKMHQTVQETQACLPTREQSVEDAKKRLKTEQANLQDQKALSQALENRTAALREGLDNRMEMSPEDKAREKISELKQRKRGYDKGTVKLLKSLRHFIDNRLAPMLAAEELGGPVVGDMVDLDEDQLAAGFSSQGRPRKPKDQPNQDKRQRRIDEIWGNREDDPQAAETASESVAAGTEMRQLVEELLNQLVDAEGDNSAAYVQLERESAAARFLVRSKVAQFHPKDSRRLRLVDFGRELDD